MLILHFIVIVSIIMSELSANSCSFNVKLRQELLKEGFHRNLTYKVTFDETYEECFIGLDQGLPAGVYAAPDELEDLLRKKKVIAISRNPVNIEQPADQSHPTIVFIINTLTGREVNLWLPVHARYHSAVEGGGYYQNKIEQPRVFLRCAHRQLDSCKSESQVTFLCSGVGSETCVWKEIPVTVVSKQPIRFAVPIGDLTHAMTVVWVTVPLVTYLSACLLSNLHEYKMAVRARERLLKMS